MALPKRSPVLGYNHNVRYRGLVFHVQTEDSGTAAPHIFTHLFHGGVIVHTRKHVYDPGAPEDAVKALMQTQHKAVLRELKANVFDDKIDDYLGATPGLLPRGAPEDGGAGALAADSSSSVPAVASAADSGSLEAIVDRVGAVAVPAAAASDVTVPLTAPRAQPAAAVPVAVARAGTGENLAAAVATAKHAHAARTVSEDQARNVTAALRGSAQAASGAGAVPPARPRRVTDARTAVASGVAASKQGVIVNAPAHVIGGNRPPPVPGSAAAVARPATAPSAAVVAAPPRAEDRGQTILDAPVERGFAKDIISEKSLDEVILAYLTDER